MNWWQKLKRAWLVITARLFTARKKGNEKCNNDSPAAGISEDISSNHGDILPGLSKLRDEVESCEYEDVHILWNMLLHAQAEQEQEETRQENCSSQTKKHPNKRPWRGYFCPINHHPTTSFAS